MARVVYGDLFGINFTPSGTTTPNTTQLPLMITNGYKLLYPLVYGANKYAADDANDTETIVLAPEMNGVLIPAFSRWAQRWNEAGKNSDGSIRPMPDFYFSDKEKKEIKTITRTIRKNRIKNTRLWNTSQDDVARW